MNPPRRAAALVAEDLTRAELLLHGNDVEDASDDDAEDYQVEDEDLEEEDQQQQRASTRERGFITQRSMRKAEEAWIAMNATSNTGNRKDIMHMLNRAAATRDSKLRQGKDDPMLRAVLTTSKSSAPSTANLLAAARNALQDSGRVQVEERARFGGQMVTLSRQVNTKEALAMKAKAEAQTGLDRVVSDIINGRKGVSTVQKSSADWDAYKHAKSLEAELADAGKKGFVEKEAFLNRVDYRQFEIERAQRERERVMREAKMQKKE
jgi:hypothetical protein